MRRRTRIKICGVCSAADAVFAARAGADAIGVVFAPSVRQLTVDEAAGVLAALPPFVARVGVFADAPAGEVADAAKRLGLTAVQLCGAESPEFCAALPVPAIKVVHVGGAMTAEEIAGYEGVVAALLLDTAVRGLAGGTGLAFDWGATPSFPDVPMIVAGGLTPRNVAEAVRTLRPYAVDVSSGVEAAPRLKDHDAIEAFIAAVAAADEEAGEW